MIYVHIHAHRYTFNVVFLLKLFSASPPSKGKYPSSRPLLPLHFFLPPHPFPSLYFGFGSSFEMKPPQSGFSFNSFHSQAQFRDRDKAAQRHLSCFFLFSKAWAEGKEKSVLWVMRPGPFLIPFSPLWTCPVYTFHVLVCLLCAAHGKGAKVNSFFQLLDAFCWHPCRALCLITSSDARLRVRWKHEYLVPRGNWEKARAEVKMVHL